MGYLALVPNLEIGNAVLEACPEPVEGIQLPEVA
jgi:hypothetical protein